MYRNVDTDLAESKAQKLSAKAILRGCVVAMISALAGGGLIASGGEASIYGLTMFMILPGVTGFVTALTVRYWAAVVASLIIALAVILISLVLTQIEGIVCVIMALPIFLLSSMTGAAIGRFVKHNFWKQENSPMLILPMLAGAGVFSAGKLEDQVESVPRRETITSSIVIDRSPEEVWQAVVEIEDVVGELPLLMKLGLPVPQSCSMTGAGIGSLRTCVFNSGSIQEVVTIWNPPHQLAFEVQQVNLPGRHWLGFVDAEYRLARDGAGRTVVTRSTTVTSVLRPAFYWRYFERLGTETEHDYVLASLKKQLEMIPESNQK